MVDILTGENLSSILLANLNLIYLSVRLSSRRGRVGIKRAGGDIVILASCEHHFIRAHENLVQRPINISIFLTPFQRS